MLAGALADHFGRRRVLIVGLFIMLAAAVACAAAPNAATLIAARLVQGVGGALVVPSSLASSTARWSPSTGLEASGSATHYRTAMLVMAALSIAAAVITAVFVTRSLPATARHPSVSPRIHGCAAPEPVTAASHPSAERTGP